MEYLFTPAGFLPEGVGFPLYGKAHLLWLLCIITGCMGMILACRRLSSKGRRQFAGAVAFSLLFLEILRDAYIILCGAWEWEYLPFHPCSFTMFFMVVWSIRPNPFCGNVLYGLGLVGAIAALIFCNWTEQPLWQFQTIYSFVFHGALVGWILMLLISGEIRPTGKGMWDCVKFLCVAVPFTGALNYLLPDCNFFFTKAGSEGSPLEFLIRIFGSPWWLLAYIGLALAVMKLEFLLWKRIENK